MFVSINTIWEMLEYNVLNVEIFGKMRILTTSARVEHKGVCYSIYRRTLKTNNWYTEHMTETQDIRELIAQKIERTCWRVISYNEQPCSRCVECANYARQAKI